MSLNLPTRSDYGSQPHVSPRGQNEPDVKNHIEHLQAYLKSTLGELKELKKQIENYRSEIGTM